MIQRLVATLTLTMGSAIAICTSVIADEPSVDIIFTGVVPPTCALNISAATDLEQNQTENQLGLSNTVRVLCNDSVQTDSNAYDYSRSNESFWDSTTLNPSAQEEFLTITVP
jgi:hypothetical protein